MLNHGINTYKRPTAFSTVVTSDTGIPFFVGCWPCHTAGGFTGKPQLIESFEQAKKLGGYSSEWRDASGNPKWSLCQALYSQFQVFGVAPVVVYNIFDPATHKSAVQASAMAVTDHIVKLPFDAIIDAGLSVENSGSELTKDTDYVAFYDNNNLVIELLESGSAYSATSLTIGYNAVSLTAINATAVEEAINKIEDAKATLGIVPDLICVPGWSKVPAVAAVMATKAANINGLFKGKAVVDLDSSASGADEYGDISAYKSANGYDDENMIVCWPMAKIGDMLFDYSVIVCGKLSELDAENDCPYESPSNKAIPITACVNAAGKEISLTVQSGDVVSYANGVVTALNFNGWTVWGNYTGCWPENKDVAECFICTNRMLDFVCNTFARMFWEYVDRPLTRVLIDAIVNDFNSWLAGLAHDGKLYGGTIEYVESNNATEDLLAGKFRLDLTEASPVPAQQINLYAEFDVELLAESINA